MPLQLTFLQYHLAATIGTALILLALLPAIFTPSFFAHATDNTSLVSENQNGLIFSDGQDFRFPLESFNGLELRDGEDEDEDEDEGLDTRSLDVVRRGPSGVSSMANNEFQHDTIKIGETQWWYFPKEQVNGKKSDIQFGFPESVGVDHSAGKNHTQPSNGIWKRSPTVYISLTTCSKPEVSTSGSGNASGFPQLEVYVSKSASLQKPGPGKDSSSQILYKAHKGYMSAVLEADGDVFIGVAAPDTKDYKGSYRYHIAASIDTYFHTVDDLDPFLYFLDADTTAAILVSNNLTQSEPGSDNYNEWMSLSTPYTMFAHNVNDTSLAGLDLSYCALNKHAHVSKKTHEVRESMTNRGLGSKPKEQFYVTGLNRSSFYYGILARDGNGTKSGNKIVGGGGKVWKPMNFTTQAGKFVYWTSTLENNLTKSEENCAVLFDLPFCSEVAYAVPSNPSLTVSELSKIYDNNAKNLYRNFSFSLQQVQCDAPPESQYSLAVNCTACERAYKEWLCAVTIPRCADFSDNAHFLHVRNAGQKFLNGSSIPPENHLRKLPATNSSRNPLIDEEIKPGPYKEILTCQDVCHTLVKNCPASLQFSCPQGKQLDWSYGVRNESGIITCNYLGAAYYLSHAPGFYQRTWGALIAVGGFWVAFWSLGV